MQVTMRYQVWEIRRLSEAEVQVGLAAEVRGPDGSTLFGGGMTYLTVPAAQAPAYGTVIEATFSEAAAE